jgi:aminoglycoside phosphotransferase (APT) family kinase protein
MSILKTREFMSTTQDEIGYGDIIQIVKKALGNRTEIAAVETAKNGDVNSNYVIHTANPGAKLFLKVENHERIPKYYLGQVKREIEGIRLLQKAGIPCPTIVDADTAGCCFGKNYILTEFAEGRLLSDVWQELNRDERVETKQKVLDLVHTMKGIVGGQFGDITEDGNRGRHGTWKGAYRALAGILLEDCMQPGLCSPAEADLIEAAVEKSVSRLNKQYTPCFNHMDIHWQNILVERRKPGVEFKAVLDFGNAMFGLPCTDEYRLYIFLFFTESFYDENTPVPYSMDQEELFSCELLYGLEFLVFEGMMKGSWGCRENILKKTREYLEG